MTQGMTQEERAEIAEMAEKAITLAILRTKSIVLNYMQIRHALEDLVDDADAIEGDVYEYVISNYRYSAADDTDFDIIIPVNAEIDSDLVEALYDEPDTLEHVIEKLLDVKITGCTLKWTVAYEAYTRARKYFDIEEDWDEFSDRTYAGWIKFTIRVNTLSGVEEHVIWEDVDYCNYCLSDPTLNIGIQKCRAYYFDKSEAEDP
jgi:hypothetical protein